MSLKLEALLRSLGDGAAEGQLEGHPCPGVVVRTFRVSPREMTISLWDNGKYRIGEGLLHDHDGHWQGTCSEYAGNWKVSGKVGVGRLEFSE